MSDDGLDGLRQDILLALIQAGVIDESFGRIIDLIDVYVALAVAHADDDHTDIPFWRIADRRSQPGGEPSQALGGSELLPAEVQEHVFEHVLDRTVVPEPREEVNGALPLGANLPEEQTLHVAGLDAIQTRRVEVVLGETLARTEAPEGLASAARASAVEERLGLEVEVVELSVNLPGGDEATLVPLRHVVIAALLTVHSGTEAIARAGSHYTR